MKHRAWWLVALVLATAALSIYWWQDLASAAGIVPVQASGAAATEHAKNGPAGPGMAVAGSPAGSQSLWQERYNRAAQTFNSYRDATRYPPGSRPLQEHPDQERPFDPITEDRVLLGNAGKIAKGMHLRTSQERVFLSGEESVAFSLHAVDDDGVRLPLSIRRAYAANIAENKSSNSLLQAEVPFADDGQAPDARARDGQYSARLTPYTQGFSTYSGTIRLYVQVNVNGENGEATFDVVYTPDVPATWLGVREALESGSLNFYLKAQVLTPGRYVVSARVQDAKGKPFALLQYNDEVIAGGREFKLQLFGALVRDVNPTFPLQLTDVEGFLLKPDVFPDRAMMARRPGAVHTTSNYQTGQFSSAEWTSEERERYLQEYRADMERARQQLEAQP
jgi:hypothetical protein